MTRSTSRTPGSRAQDRERGAVAVEFALVAPILLALVAGIVEFSHAYNLQISVTQAAREAARTMAIENDQGWHGSRRRRRAGPSSCILRLHVHP